MNQHIVILNNIRLCGITGTPENPRLQKTALTGFDTVPWEYKKSALRTIKELKKQGFTIIALEITDKSQPIEPVQAEKVALVLGHEREGVDERILAEANKVMHIPMHGAGKSLNVAVAFGIASYHIFH